MVQRSLLRSSQSLQQAHARLRSRFAQKFTPDSTLAHGLQMQSSTNPEQTLCHLEAARQRLCNRYIANWPAVGENHAQSDVVIKPVQTALPAESKHLEAARARLCSRFSARWPLMTSITAEEDIETQSNEDLFDFAEFIPHGNASTHRPTSPSSTLLAIMGQGHRQTSPGSTLVAIMAQGDRMLWQTRAASTL
jgi:hypothetical protein